MEELREWTPIAGVPQGAVLFPGAVEFVPQLTMIIWCLIEVSRWVRYADDFVVLCRSESEAASALN